MAGHSKWNNIKHRKGKTDAQRAKIFTKLSREIIVAVREGGADPGANAKLRDVTAKARAANVPNDNIKRVIDKAAGNQDNTDYEAITYEGYGPCGVAVIVTSLTDNRVRTVADVRHAFDKCGGNLGSTGCARWAFNDEMKPMSMVDIIEESDAIKMQKMLDMLEDLDDVQEVYHNWEG